MRLGRWFVLSLVVAFAGMSSTAQAAVFVYQTFLDGPSEAPPNASPGTGFAQVTYDDVTHMMTVTATFQGLTGTTSAAHIHTPTPNPPATQTAGVATQVPSFSTFPLGVTSGVMPPTVYDLTQASSWNPAYITANGGTPAGAEAAFIASMNNQPPHPNLPSRAYFNIHSSTFPGGEIRGFFALIPEPATLGLAAASALALVAAGRRARTPLA
jgi:hypothetical protein